MVGTSPKEPGKYAVDVRGAQGVQIGDGNQQTNVFGPVHFYSTEPGPASSPGQRGRGPWRVFLSHTGELAQYPGDQSFVATAKKAIERAGHVSVEMDTWTASPSTPKETCEQRVRDCDVYAGIFGFRWGSPVRNDPDRSYAELEFDTAQAADLPRLAFVLPEDLELAVPRSFWIDEQYGDRQIAFRNRIDKSGLTRATVRSPQQLEVLLYQALTELTAAASR
jgi:hypothetical protein